VTSPLGWYDVPPTALKIQWIWICMKTTTATWGKNRSWWHHNSVGTTFPLQLWRYNEFEFVWRPL
jgi:hypothetical protein